MANHKLFSCFGERKQASACLKNKWRKTIAFVPNAWYSNIRWLIKCLLKYRFEKVVDNSIRL